MKHWYTNGITEKCFDEEVETIPPDFYRGRSPLYSQSVKNHTLSEETKKKISEKAKNRTAHNKGKKETIKHCYYTNGITNVRIPITENPPEGFYKGRIMCWTEESKRRKAINTAATKLERYGSSTYNNISKNKATKALNFGDENYNNRKKAQETCLERYKVNNPSKVDAVKEKIRKTNLSKYGYVNRFSNPDVLAKAAVNSHTPESEEKRMSTCMSKYGVPYAGCVFGIPKSKDSNVNLGFRDLLIKENLYTSDEENREFLLGKYRYDFKIGNILLELNPSITHNSTFSIYSSEPRSKEYHYQKTLYATQEGYRCIHIWDWDDVSKIINLIKSSQRILYARKCEVREVNKQDTISFINKYHLQGYTNSKINLGLYFENELVSVMTFGKPRYNKKYEYELIRFCSSDKVVGGAEKLFKYFVNTYAPKSIISYCDLSKFTGKTYSKLGFTYLQTSIGKHWYNTKTNQHITDNLLRQQGFDRLFKTNYGKGTSNEQLMLENGFVEIYDAGQATYIYNNE